MNDEIRSKGLAYQTAARQKDVKPKKRGRKIRTDVKWIRGVKGKGVKQMDVKHVLSVLYSIKSAVEIGINVFNYVKLEADLISNERLNTSQALMV
jgi:hypothetical protein